MHAPLQYDVQTIYSRTYRNGTIVSTRVPTLSYSTRISSSSDLHLSSLSLYSALDAIRSSQSPFVCNFYRNDYAVRRGERAVVSVRIDARTFNDQAGLMRVEKFRDMALEYYNLSTSVGGVEGRMEMTGRENHRNYYYVKDHLGSSRMTLAAGTEAFETVEATMYRSYVKMLPIGGQSAVSPTREKFTGKEFDEEGEGDGMGLYYFGARLLDPEIGIFTSTDPMAQYFNLYSYGNGNPINGTDPDGMLWYNTDDENDRPTLGRSKIQVHVRKSGTHTSTQSAFRAAIN